MFGQIGTGEAAMENFTLPTFGLCSAYKLCILAVGPKVCRDTLPVTEALQKKQVKCDKSRLARQRWWSSSSSALVSFPGGCLPEESPALLSEPNSPRLCNAKSGGVGFNSFLDFASNYNIFLNFTSNCNTFLDFASNSNFNIFLNFASNCNTFLDFASNFNIFEFASYCNP